ncbi:hypothetical protein EJ110_NYTH58521 [Nymphaea thermarum]|nr:hypothetical protein EJ110_NYTH58521 [Nymphaea thermarum]
MPFEGIEAVGLARNDSPIVRFKMAEKEKEKDEEVAEVSSNGDVMKEEKNVMVLEKPEECGKKEVADEESKEIVKDVKEGEEETNEAVENDQNGKEGNDKENVEEEDKEKKETKKRRRGVSKSKEKDKKEKEKDIKDTKKEIKAKGVRKRKEPGTPAAATIGRPTRERKSVERFVISSEKELSKELLIEKGHGTQLKDIPNVITTIL